MNETLEHILIVNNTDEINVTIKAVKNTGDIRYIETNLEEYIDHFGYTNGFCRSDLDVLNEEYLTEKETIDGVEFTSATIRNYDFDESIEFDELLNLCEILYDCDTREERMMVIDYLSCVSSLSDSRSLSEIKDRLAFRNREALIDFLKSENSTNSNSQILDFVDYDKYVEEIIRYDYTETPNGFLFYNY